MEPVTIKQIQDYYYDRCNTHDFMNVVGIRVRPKYLILRKIYMGPVFDSVMTDLEFCVIGWS